MLDKETKARIADFFDGHELVEFLQLKVEDVIDMFEDDVEDAIDDIEELMGINRDDD